MKCPKCDGQLTEEKLDNILVNRCNRCSGIWLDYPELSQIEDTVWSDEESKGELEFNEHPGNQKCPKCDSLMVKFNYRYSDLVLDTCPNMHGFWLDNGEEEKKIKEIMKEDKSSFERKIKAENEWAKTLNHLQSKGFMEKVKNFLNI
jgi:Zn-finger nucleic acid-binding protein